VQAVVEEFEYLPASHAVQSVAPGRCKVLVTDPAEHEAQASEGEEENLPALHAVQVVAPSPPSLLVKLPGLQVMQLACPGSGW